VSRRTRTTLDLAILAVLTVILVSVVASACGPLEIPPEEEMDVPVGATSDPLRCTCPILLPKPTPIAITTDPGWTAANGLAYWMDALGIVHLRGAIRAGEEAPAIAFTLPVTYRPKAIRVFSATLISGESALPTWIAVYEYGAVVLGDPPVPGAKYFLDEIDFLAEQ
jgi:hypothetical protein